MPDIDPIAAGFVLPHPPIIVPGVGRGPHQAGQTVRAIERLAQEMAQIKPDTVVLVSPHAPMFSDYLFMYGGEVLHGSLERFGAPAAQVAQPNDLLLHSELIRLLEQAGLAGGTLTAAQMRAHRIDGELDHGAVVPLFFLAKAYPDFAILAISCSNLPLPSLYRLGGLIRQAAANCNRRIVLVASGDQSHKVNAASPYGSCPEGSTYDRLVAESLSRGDLAALLGIDCQLREKAAECGYRSLVILSGAFSRRAVTSEVLSCEAPYGIGYCVAAVRPDPGRPEAVPDAWEEALARSRHTHAAHADESPAVHIARTALETYIREHRRLNGEHFAILRERSDAAFLWQQRGGAFVSLKMFGDLRGCIGTTSATTASLAEEVIQNALSAGLHDPRFEPVREDELADLAYSVDILGAAEPAGGPEDLDPKVYGVIVQSGARSGLLLPDLEGVDSVEEQLRIACRKAGIRSTEPYQIKRFRVTRYH
jgi:AmmeMemoRadiSam system protein A